MNIKRLIILFLTLFLIVPSCKEEYDLPPVGDNNTTSYKGGYVSGFHTFGSKVLFAIDIAEAGQYNLDISYATTEKSDASASIFINDTKYVQINMPQTPDETDWQIYTQRVILKNGINYISIQRDIGDNGLFNLNYIEIKR